MAAKVVWYREAWWVRTRWGGNRKREKRIGPTKADKRLAVEIARKVNAALALGTFDEAESRTALPCDVALRDWHKSYKVTL